SNYFEGAPADARQSIIDNFGWIITDGGMVGSTLYEISATANPSGFGMINGLENFSQQYGEGENVYLVASPQTGYEFVNWTENETEVSTYNPYSFTASQARNLVANFKDETAISEFNGDATVIVYPNPANDFITIKLDNYEINSNKVKIALYDLSGKAYRIENFTISQNRITLDVSDKASGLYFVQMIIDNQEIETAKVRIVK
nr:T9SS type A sorting domain-containing protein [Salinivirgaceae bacterium]